jgi:hypothetical protein
MIVVTVLECSVGCAANWVASHRAGWRQVGGGGRSRARAGGNFLQLLVVPLIFVLG